MRKLITKSKYEFRNNYYADDSGHIWSENKQNFLKEYNDKAGYKKVVLMTTDKDPSRGHRFSVHRLILETFKPVPNMSILQVDHINGNRTDNRLENLRWTTPSENLNNPNTLPNRRVYDQDGLNNASSKFVNETLSELVKDINSGLYTRKEIASKYGITTCTLRKLINKEHYKEELKDVIIIPNFKSDYAREVSGEKNGRAKLSEDDVKEIIDLLLSKKYTNKQIADDFNVSASTISHIKKKDTWAYLTKDINFD